MLGIGIIIAAIVGFIALIIVLFVVLSYNNLISKRNRVQDAWAQIDVQLKRRYDLIPNLLETVKGYSRYEKGVLTDVTRLRSSLMSGSIQDKAAANNQLSQTLKSIFAVAENYPDLKASANFMNLQQQLEDTEDKISFVRTSYNDYVLDYNNAIQTFPGNLFAGGFHFARMDFFQAPAGQTEPVKVDFSDLGGGQPAAAPAQAGAPAPKPKKQKGNPKSKPRNPTPPQQ